MHCTLEPEGTKSDLKVWKQTDLQVHKKIKLKADLAYVGINKIHSRSQLPHKKPKNGELTKKQRRQNKRFRSRRVKVEHVIRRCKIFRIVKERYRNKRRNLQKVWSVVCGLVNLKT